jgi:hypothetical protein
MHRDILACMYSVRTKQVKKEPDDRNKLKIASFRTTDGDWFDFSQAAESNGFTATDVLKACMVDYQAGTYKPSVSTPVSIRLDSAQGVTAEDVQEAIEQALAPIQTDLADLLSQVHELRRPDGDAFGANSAIEQAIAPIQTDLADLLLRIDALESDRATLPAPHSPEKPAPGEPLPGKQAKAKPPKQGHSETEVQKWVKRCEADPELRAAIEEGLGQNLAGKPLVDWVFSKGFGANENTKPFDSSVATRMRGAIEYLNSPKTRFSQQ